MYSCVLSSNWHPIDIHLSANFVDSLQQHHSTYMVCFWRSSVLAALLCIRTYSSLETVLPVHVSAAGVFPSTLFDLHFEDLLGKVDGKGSNLNKLCDLHHSFYTRLDWLLLDLVNSWCTSQPMETDSLKKVLMNLCCWDVVVFGVTLTLGLLLSSSLDDYEHSWQPSCQLLVKKRM